MRRSISLRIGKIFTIIGRLYELSAVNYLWVEDCRGYF